MVAILAIADQGRALNGQPALDSTNPQEVMDILYKNPGDFHDITSGTSTGSPHYSAGPGYDYVTGLGSPMANLVVDSLDGRVDRHVDKLVLSAPTAETAGTSFSLTVTAERSNGTTDTGYSARSTSPAATFRRGCRQTSLSRRATTERHIHGHSQYRRQPVDHRNRYDDVRHHRHALRNQSSARPPPAGSSCPGFPRATTAGVSQTLTVTAEDPYGNVATGYTGTVEFTSSDPKASLPGNYKFSQRQQGGQYVLGRTR